MNQRFIVTENYTASNGGSLITELPNVTDERIIELFGEVPDEIFDKYSQQMIIEDTQSGFFFAIYTREGEYRIGSVNDKVRQDKKYMATARELCAFISTLPEKQISAPAENESWEADSGGDRDYDTDSVTVIVYSKLGTVAKVTGGPNDIDGKKAFARANLIAAAPELLRMLKELHHVMSLNKKAFKGYDMQYVESAIAKAEGKQ